MKKLLIVTGIVFFSAIGFAQEKAKKKNTETVKYWVSMSCENCKAKVEKNIAYEKGIKDMIVDLDTKTVTLTYKPGKTTPEKLEKAIQDLGYKTEKLETVKPSAEKKETKKK